MKQLIRLGVVVGLIYVLAACGASGGQTVEAPAEPDPIDSAAAEATAIVQQARATAIVLEARAQATALVEQARLAGGTPTSAVEDPVPYASPTAPPTGEPPGPTPTVADTAVTDEPAGEPLAVQVQSVSFAAEGAMIMVRFLAPPEEAAKWWPGSVSVTDEGNGAVYNEIPVMPKIGPLIGRPKQAGQLGYVMLVNAPPGLQRGALVTVVLGTYTFGHILVE